jgi:hypothetical protein
VGGAVEIGHRIGDGQIYPAVVRGHNLHSGAQMAGKRIFLNMIQNFFVTDRVRYALIS